MHLGETGIALMELGYLFVEIARSGPSIRRPVDVKSE
jgi:hypothetical protein